MTTKAQEGDSKGAGGQLSTIAGGDCKSESEGKSEGKGGAKGRATKGDGVGLSGVEYDCDRYRYRGLEGKLSQLLRHTSGESRMYIDEYRHITLFSCAIGLSLNIARLQSTPCEKNVSLDSKRKETGCKVLTNRNAPLYDSHQ